MDKSTLQHLQWLGQAWETLKKSSDDIDRIARHGLQATPFDKELVTVAFRVLSSELRVRAANAKADGN